MLSDEKYTNTPSKCDICQYRYACDDYDEYNCKTNDYRRFTLDKEKLKLYEKEKSIMEYKIFRITYNDGGWHSGDLPHFFYIAHNEEEVKSNSKNYADFKERQDAFGGDIWMHEVKGVEFPSEWENLKDFNVSITAIPREVK